MPGRAAPGRRRPKTGPWQPCCRSSPPGNPEPPPRRQGPGHESQQRHREQKGKNRHAVNWVARYAHAGPDRVPLCRGRMRAGQKARNAGSRQGRARNVPRSPIPGRRRQERPVEALSLAFAAKAWNKPVDGFGTTGQLSTARRSGAELFSFSGQHGRIPAHSHWRSPSPCRIREKVACPQPWAKPIYYYYQEIRR